MDRLETRELAYFLAVADELHFGRAAAHLGVAQPALSKTIQRLERRLGVTLFERTSRAVALTVAGQVLARDARTVLEAVSAAAERTQRAGIRDPHLILAVKPGGDAGLLPAILAAYEREDGVLPIEVVFGGDRVRMLREGKADAAMLYAPPDDLRGLDTEILLSDVPVAVLPVAHPLAHRACLRMTDLAGENLHKHPTDANAMGSISELMHLIALRRTVAVLPRSLTTPLRDDRTTGSGHRHPAERPSPGLARAQHIAVRRGPRPRRRGGCGLPRPRGSGQARNCRHRHDPPARSSRSAFPFGCAGIAQRPMSSEVGHREAVAPAADTSPHEPRKPHHSRRHEIASKTANFTRSAQSNLSRGCSSTSETPR